MRDPLPRAILNPAPPGTAHRENTPLCGRGPHPRAEAPARQLDVVGKLPDTVIDFLARVTVGTKRLGDDAFACDARIER